MEIDNYTKKIRNMPPGHLNCTKNGKYLKYYQSEGQHPIYIPKKRRCLAEQLAIKKYYSQKKTEKEKELIILNEFISQYEKIDFKAETFLEKESEYHQLLQAYFKTHTLKEIQWMQAEFKTNSAYPEHLVHKTLDGHYVRSKSEVIIANALYINKIPYRYECELQMKDAIYYPDFTILNSNKQKCMYWEHFGMMDKSSYRNHVLEKMSTYLENGIIPTINLVTTYETMKAPIDSEKIQRIIEEYFM